MTYTLEHTAETASGTSSSASPLFNRSSVEHPSPVSVTTAMMDTPDGTMMVTPPRRKSAPSTTTSTPYYYDASNVEPTSTSKSKSTSSDCRPFFLMDWLEEFVSPSQDVYQLAELLRTPGKFEFDTVVCGGSTPGGRKSTAASVAGCYKNIEEPSTPKSSNRKKRVSSPCFNPLSSLSLSSVGKGSNRGGPVVAGDGVGSRTPPDLKPKTLFQDDTTSVSSCNSSKSGSTSSPSHPLKKKTSSPSTAASLRQSQLTLGNGWNAKGLKKAQQGLWRDALACWDMALELRLPILSPMSEEVANTWNNRGIALGKLGEYQRALDSLDKALKIRLYNNRKSNKSKKANSLSGEGNSSSTASAAVAASRSHSITIIISTYHNIANVHQQKGDYGKALEVFGHAKSLCYEDYSESDDGFEAQGFPATIADTARSSTKNDSSSSILSSMLSMARICAAMGHVYYQAEQWIDARDAYYDAVQVYEQLQQLQRKMEKKNAKNDQVVVDDYEEELKELQKDIKELDNKVLLEQQLKTKRGYVDSIMT